MKATRILLITSSLMLFLAQAACSGSEPAQQDGARNGLSLIALPSSAIVVADRVQIIAYGADSKKMWSYSLPDNDVIATAPIAAGNSNTYVRGEKAVYAVTPDGKLGWSAKLEDTTGPIKGIVSLGDSTVAVTRGESQLVSYSHDGQVRWTFTLPDGDRLTAAPVTAPNSAIFMRGANGLYAVDPNGNLSWRSDIQ